ncbi:NAD(P)H-binding protein [Pseudomonas aeruginosa]|nr:NAD(P)H-binding protein [Pseudomonas aeruginosa]EKL8601718.1 NAD(P)H-binding protein [Pseudomonas aeruginosa]EKW7912802.1 NAD(P)H-binding protein [Pseudomonas aeruginosa]EKX0395858.1 NAD(P)H-binding protein [Pseudomonas aeruginosa]EKY1568402.1 NAD(P)H-binding protein [Pseudomonas aeruginosa]
MMKIVILGAMGTTGQYAVDYALAAGHEVIAYVRNPGAVKPRPGLTAIGGSVGDQAAMAEVFASADAVISCLGAQVAVETLLGGTDFLRRMLPRLIGAINAAGVPRFVLMSSFGIGETAKKAGFIYRYLFMAVIAKRLFDDKAIAEQLLANCKANWTAVYPVSLKDGLVDKDWDMLQFASVSKVPGLPVLSFATVAKVLVELVKD